MKLGTLCYIKHNGKTLMLHLIKKENDVHQGNWNGLGGKFEPGETPEECIIREVHEESGLVIHAPRLKGILTFPLFDGIDDWTVFVFVAHHFEGALKDSPEGRLEWIDDECVRHLNLWEGDRIFLNWLDGDAFFSGKFVYKNKHLAAHSVVFHASMP